MKAATVAAASLFSLHEKSRHTSAIRAFFISFPQGVLNCPEVCDRPLHRCSEKPCVPEMSSCQLSPGESRVIRTKEVS